MIAPRGGFPVAGSISLSDEKGVDAMSRTLGMIGIRSELQFWIAVVIVWAAAISMVLAIVTVLLSPAQ
jgi:membrane-associated protease RseP (regulator of RpoE activity)